MEIFKDIVGYEGLYKISDKGTILSIGKGRTKILKNIIHKKGYTRINLSKKGKMKVCEVHRLIAIAHIPNPEGLPCVCHKKESFPLDNSKNNLWWGTHKQNMIDRDMKGRNPIKSGIDHPKSKKVLQYSKEGEFIKEWYSITKAVTELGISQPNVSNCCRGRNKTCGGFIWKYK